MKRKIAIAVIAIVALSCSFLTQPTVWAEKKCGGASTILIECGEDENEIDHVLTSIIDIFSAIVGVVAAIGIGIVGVQYLTAGGNEEQTRKAKRRMLEIVIGLFLYVIMYFGLKWLLPGYSSGSESDGSGAGESSYESSDAGNTGNSSSGNGSNSGIDRPASELL